MDREHRVLWSWKRTAKDITRLSGHHDQWLASGMVVTYLPTYLYKTRHASAHAYPNPVLLQLACMRSVVI